MSLNPSAKAITKIQKAIILRNRFSFDIGLKQYLLFLIYSAQLLAKHGQHQSMEFTFAKDSKSDIYYLIKVGSLSVHHLDSQDRSLAHLLARHVMMQQSPLKFSTDLVENYPWKWESKEHGELVLTIAGDIPTKVPIWVQNNYIHMIKNRFQNQWLDAIAELDAQSQMVSGNACAEV